MATTEAALANVGEEESARMHAEHSVPLSVLIAVWLALMALTAATVAIAQLDLGRLDLVLAIGIATIKASLVCLFFMHLYWERPIMGMLFLGCLGFVFLFISLTLVDSSHYLPNIEARQRDAPVILHVETAAPQ